MSKVITIPFTDDFIERLADYLYREHALKGRDLRRVVLVFGGSRPALFLKRALAKRIKTAFFPPAFLTIDEWMKHIVKGKGEHASLSALDHCYLIFELVAEHTPELLKGRERFASFLPWAQEILSVIDQLDLEDAGDDVLRRLKQEAQIGFDVPESLGLLLEKLFVLRRVYHEALLKRNVLSRGLLYRTAARHIQENPVKEWEEIIFCNFFYLHRTEMKVLEACFTGSNTTLMIQGDQRRWPALKRISSLLKQDILEGPEVIEGDFKLKLHAAFDVHSQAVMVASMLKDVPDPGRTVVVLPQAESVLPFLSALAPVVKEFNISLGYPLKRSAIFGLLENIFSCQRSRQGELYYTRDYLKLLRHPFIKNSVDPEDVLTASVMTAAIEDMLTGAVVCELSGRLFLDLQQLTKSAFIHEKVQESLRVRGVEVSKEKLEAVLENIHDVFFHRWSRAVDFSLLAEVLIDFSVILRGCSSAAPYPFNERVIASIEEISQELGVSSFARHPFLPTEMYRILEDVLGRQMVAFSGSPLRGLQLLGLFETRALSFDDVIIVDVNEGVLPNLNIYEPLIPRDMMIKLNLDRLELEEEIQRYGFMRLISSAKRVHLIYQERPDRERSRFIEELIWEEEKKAGSLDIVPVERARFQAQLLSKPRSVPKTPSMVDFLKNMTYSASSLNTYLRNPYEFYENYVLGLRQKDNLLDDPQARQVGTFIHEVLEEAFKVFIGRKPVLDDLFKRNLFKIMDRRFDEVFLQRQEDAFLMRAVLQARFERFCDVESRRCERDVQEIIALEQKWNGVVEVGVKRLRMTCRIDRVERLCDGSVLVLDYKTGVSDALFKNVDELLTVPLTREMIRDSLGSFQMPLYLDVLLKQYSHTAVNAALYHLRTQKLESYLDEVSYDNASKIVTASMKAMDMITDEIFDVDVPFVDDPVRSY